VDIALVVENYQSNFLRRTERHLVKVAENVIESPMVPVTTH
jgi:hypothetical protein